MSIDLTGLKKTKPVYVSRYQDKIDAMLKQIEEREPFSFNFNADALYRQLRDRYERAGKMNMLDVNADSAARTNGFENSYGATAGAQSYLSTLQSADDFIPELEKRARERYDEGTNELYDKLEAYRNAENDDRQRYQTELNDYYNAMQLLAALQKSSSSGKKKKTSAVTLQTPKSVVKKGFTPLSGIRISEF